MPHKSATHNLTSLSCLNGCHFMPMVNTRARVEAAYLQQKINALSYDKKQVMVHFEGEKKKMEKRLGLMQSAGESSRHRVKEELDLMEHVKQDIKRTGQENDTKVKDHIRTNRQVFIVNKGVLHQGLLKPKIKITAPAIPDDDATSEAIQSHSFTPGPGTDDREFLNLPKHKHDIDDMSLLGASAVFLQQQLHTGSLDDLLQIEDIIVNKESRSKIIKDAKDVKSAHRKGYLTKSKSETDLLQLVLPNDTLSRISEESIRSSTMTITNTTPNDSTYNIGPAELDIDGTCVRSSSARSWYSTGTDSNGNFYIPDIVLNTTHPDLSVQSTNLNFDKLDTCASNALVSKQIESSEIVLDNRITLLAKTSNFSAIPVKQDKPAAAIDVISQNNNILISNSTSKTTTTSKPNNVTMRQSRSPQARERISPYLNHGLIPASPSKLSPSLLRKVYSQSSNNSILGAPLSPSRNITTLRRSFSPIKGRSCSPAQIRNLPIDGPVNRSGELTMKTPSHEELDFIKRALGSNKRPVSPSRFRRCGQLISSSMEIDMDGSLKAKPKYGRFVSLDIPTNNEPIQKTNSCTQMANIGLKDVIEIDEFIRTSPPRKRSFTFSGLTEKQKIKLPQIIQRPSYTTIQTTPSGSDI